MSKRVNRHNRTCNSGAKHYKKKSSKKLVNDDLDYFNRWLESPEYFQFCSAKKNEKIDNTLIIKAFSQFIASYNKDYRYNQSYLPSFINDFTEISERLKLKTGIVNNMLYYIFKRSDIEGIEKLKISLNDIIIYEFDKIDKKKNVSCKVIVNSNLDRSTCLSDDIIIIYTAKLVNSNNKIIFKRNANLNDMNASGFYIKTLGIGDFFDLVGIRKKLEI